jgi:hypothetical protein
MKKHYWKKTDFWGKLRDTFGIFGGLTTTGLAGVDFMTIANIDEKWILISAGATLFGTILGIWMTDEDGDGTVDMFQD